MKLGEFGAEARPAIPYLIGILSDSYTVVLRVDSKTAISTSPSKEAHGALQKIGKPAVEALIGALGDKEVPIRQNAAEILGNISDVRAVEPLMGALKDG